MGWGCLVLTVIEKNPYILFADIDSLLHFILLNIDYLYFSYNIWGHISEVSTWSWLQNLKYFLFLKVIIGLDYMFMTHILEPLEIPFIYGSIFKNHMTLFCISVNLYLNSWKPVLNFWLM